MLKLIRISLLFWILPYIVLSQNSIKGQVLSGNTPVEGANVYILGSYDGATTDHDGTFNFETTSHGIQTLRVSFLGKLTEDITADIKALSGVKVSLKEDLNTLDTVVLSAGAFEAGDNSKVSVLKPLDVVTTASALGDAIGALQTLPGTSTVAEDGRLFVRGGDANETQTFIDGMRVFSPYTPTTNNIPTRGRFSPFLFDGITFSTGGYSAEYGQALSSVLLMNTIDMPEQNKTDISIMSVGGGVGHTEKWNKSAFSINTSYLNLSPYLSLFPDRNNWIKPFQAYGGETVFRHQFKKGLLKWYNAYNATNFELEQDHIDSDYRINYDTDNRNFFSTLSYDGKLNHNLNIETGISVSHTKNDIDVADSKINTVDDGAHLKLKLTYKLDNHFKINLGSEYFLTNLDENHLHDNTKASYNLENSILANFIEANWLISKQFAVKAGIRASNPKTENTWSYAPRISMAYKATKKSQLSLAYGDFYQQPSTTFLKYDTTLKSSKAKHYILNYQFKTAHRVLRAEAYFKSYDQLTTYSMTNWNDINNIDDNGNGYAKGIDLFWRDNKTFKNFEYWLSYSFLDTERKYANYPEMSQPPFANKHNLSLVTKWFITDWQSQIGFSYNFASGRTYTNPNKVGFLQEQTKAYNNLSFNWAYLISQQKILYASVNNILGFNNINGYQYSQTPNETGIFERKTLLPAADQFFFIGFFWTISENGKDNQLNNL